VPDQKGARVKVRRTSPHQGVRRDYRSSGVVSAIDTIAVSGQSEDIWIASAGLLQN